MKVRVLQKLSILGHVFFEDDIIETTAYEIPDEIVTKLVADGVVEVLAEDD